MLLPILAVASDVSNQGQEFFNSLKTTAHPRGNSLEDAGIILLNLLLACVIGKLIGTVYRRTYTGTRFDRRLSDSHMLLCLGGALIWSVVGNQLVYAFGLAGMVGLIRYRTSVRDPKDTTILLFSMILGMACGLGQYMIAIIGTAVIVSALYFLHFNARRDRKGIVTESRNILDIMKDNDTGEDL